MKLRKRPPKVLIIVVVILLVPAIGGWLAWRTLNGPTAAPVSQPSSAAATESTPVTHSLTGHYFAVRYPSEFTTVNEITSQDPNSLEQYRLGATAHGVTTAVISIAKQPAAGLGDDSSYKLRKIQPDVYRESTETYGTNQATVMTKQDGSETTAFIVKSPYLATIAVTSSSPVRSSADSLKGLAAAFQWVQN